MEIDGGLGSEATVSDVLHFVEGLLEGELNRVANMANVSALLYEYLEEINWVGFYIAEARSGDFVLGPFVGRPACTRISPPRGVIGTSVQSAKTLIVDDVLQFPEHIACDAASRSEIVVPIIVDRRVVAVIDVDSPQFSRFTVEHRTMLEAIAQKLATRWHSMQEYW